VHHLEEWL